MTIEPMIVLKAASLLVLLINPINPEEPMAVLIEGGVMLLASCGLIALGIFASIALS